MRSFLRHCVVAHNEHVAHAGIAMLERGGNAVDAAVAMAFASGVVDPVNATLAGSGYMLGVDADGRDPWSVEFPARAPRHARADMFDVVEDAGVGAIGVSAVRDRDNAVGPRAVAVPAALKGLCEASRTRGRLPLATVAAPAIRLAHDGFEVDAYYTLFATVAREDLRRCPAAADVLLPGGEPPVGRFNLSVSGSPGPRIVQRALGELLEQVARRGADHLYGGPAGRQLAAELQAAGGVLTAEDLARYACRHGRPLRVAAGDETELLLPTAPSGAWTVQALVRLWGALVPASRDLLGDEAAAHLAAESARRAFADRYRFHGDPEQANVPLAGLLSDGYLAEVASRVGARAEVDFGRGGQAPWDHYARRALHDPWSFDPGGAGLDPAPDTGSSAGTASGTTHFCAVDADRLTVSCTFTAGEAFGSRVLLEGSGLLLDSGMLWFNANPGYANSIAPWKRPVANMAPLILRARDGRVAALGASGGRRIISAVAQIARRVAGQGMGMQEAIDRPRFDASGTKLLVGSRAGGELLAALAARGHDVAPVDERRSPYDYEFARPVGIAWDPSGRIEGGVHASMSGVVLGE